MARSASSSPRRPGINWGYAGALLAGGVIAAPIAAWLVKHLAARVLGVAAGGLIMLTNSKTLLEAVGVPGVGVAVTAAVIFVLWIAGIVWAVKQERLSRAVAADEPELEPRPPDRRTTVVRRGPAPREGGGVRAWPARADERPSTTVTWPTYLTNWPYARLRQGRLRPPGPDRDRVRTDGTAVSAEQLGKAQGIPHGFLQAILADLRRADIVVSQRGQSGGWRFAREPATVTVADVIRAVDGPLVSVYGLRPEAVEYGDSAQVLQHVWIAARSSLRSVFERVSIQDLADGKLPEGVAALTRTRTPGSRTDALRARVLGGQPLGDLLAAPRDLGQPLVEARLLLDQRDPRDLRGELSSPRLSGSTWTRSALTSDSQAAGGWTAKPLGDHEDHLEAGEPVERERRLLGVGLEEAGTLTKHVGLGLPRLAADLRPRALDLLALEAGGLVGAADLEVRVVEHLGVDVRDGDPPEVRGPRASRRASTTSGPRWSRNSVLAMAPASPARRRARERGSNAADPARVFT